MIVISAEIIKTLFGGYEPFHTTFLEWDDGDVFNLIRADSTSGNAPGTIVFTSEKSAEDCKHIGNVNDKVRIVITQTKPFARINDPQYMLHGYVKRNGSWKKSPVQEIPVKEELYSRSKGLIETDVLESKTVAIFGLGSAGCRCAP